jgi:hypothetical protein
MTLRDATEHENSAALQSVSQYAIRPQPAAILIGEVVHSNQLFTRETGMAFVGIAENKTHFVTAKGAPFFVMGANYQGYFDRAWRMWESNRFDPALIDRDFGKLSQTGLNVVRLFVHAALDSDIHRGDFSKLDRVLQIAANHNLLVLLTFNDTHYLDLSYAAQVDTRIAARYQDDPIILGWDLESAPKFYNLAAAIYPGQQPPPLQTNLLVNHYGPRISQAEALELQQQRRIPQHLNPQQAYYYINALEYFIEFANEAKAWGAPTGKSVVDYIYSTDSARWHKLIEGLNGTLAAWLVARRGPVRQADPNHLITVGFSWLHFAGLPANRALDFQEFHLPGTGPDLGRLNVALSELDSLQAAFVDQPVLVGEFGFSNQTSTNPASSRPVAEKTTALFESAVMAHLRANSFAGGLKWVLNDVDSAANPYESSFGLYRTGNHAKAIRHLLAGYSQAWPTPPTSGQAHFIQAPDGLALRLDLGNTTTLAGSNYQDESFSWQPDGAAACFLTRQETELMLHASGAGQIAVDPWEVLPGWERGHEAILYRLVNQAPTEQATFPPDERVTWRVQADTVYRLALGAVPDTPPDEDPAPIIPNPGEHVVVLPDSNQSLHVTLPYIRTFGPDISFAERQIAGRWPYVTIIGDESQIPEAVLDDIREAGVTIVDRIAGDIEAILNGLIARNDRFLSSASLTLLADSPVASIVPSSPAEVEIYVVQPGETLSTIALKFYNKSSQWSIIFEANRDVLDSPNHIRPGLQLKIPLIP